MAGKGVTKISNFRNGYSGSDTTIIEQYTVYTTGPDVSVYEVCRPLHFNRDTSLGGIDGDAFPTLNGRHPDSLLFRVLPGGITAVRLEDNGSVWRATVTYTQTAMMLDDISNFKQGKRIQSVVAEGAYGVLFPDGDDQLQGDSPNLAFLNSSNELYDPVDTQISEYSTILQFVKRQELEFDQVDSISFQGSINEKLTTILGFEIQPYQGLMLTVAPELRVDEDAIEGDNYIDIRYKFDELSQIWSYVKDFLIRVRTRDIVLEVAGERAAAFLQGAVSNNIIGMKKGETGNSFLFDKKGKLIDAVSIKNLGEDKRQRQRYLITANDPGRVKKWLEALQDGYVLFDEEDIFAKVEGPVVIEEKRGRRSSPPPIKSIRKTGSTASANSGSTSFNFSFIFSSIFSTSHKHF